MTSIAMIFQTAIIISFIIGVLFFMTIITIVGIFNKLFFGEITEEKPKERVKVIYIVKNGSSNEIQIEETDNAIQTVPNENVNDTREKQSLFSRTVKFISRIAVLTIKTILIMILGIIFIIIVSKLPK